MPNKITKLINILGAMYSVMKPSLILKHTRLKIYKNLARPILAYGCEAWTIRRSDETRLTAADMRFMRRREDCKNGATNEMRK
jgi:hypothetical protein